MQVLGFTVKDDLMVLETTWALPTFKAVCSSICLTWTTIRKSKVMQQQVGNLSSALAVVFYFPAILFQPLFCLRGFCSVVDAK